MTAHPDPLDRLIASADPVPPTDPAFGSDVDPVLDEVWEQLRPELSTATPSRRRVRRLVPTTLGIAAVAALTAAAPFIATHTGQPNPPEEVAAGGLVRTIDSTAQTSPRRWPL